MARFIGLDIGARYVRVAVLNTAYRRVSIERFEEVAISEPDGLRAAITTAASHLMPHTDGLATAIEGDQIFTHRFTLPPTAAKQLSEVLPFEIEAQVPVDMDELVFDYRVLARPNNQAPIVALVAAARTEHVRARIALVSEALGREPERVACGSMALANLASVSATLRGPGPVAILDLGGRRTENHADWARRAAVRAHAVAWRGGPAGGGGGARCRGAAVAHGLVCPGWR
ncbi:MAG: pilus assembly protein PilM [Polyangiaceae bacterium]